MKNNILPPLLAPVALAALLAGCVTAPTPESTVSSWEPTADARPKTGVWDDLRQRQPDLTKPLSLAELTDLALHNSAVTRKAWHDARAAAAQVDKAEGLFMPALTATAGGERSGIADSRPANFNAQMLQYGPGLQLNYLVINFGGGRAAAVEQALQTVYTANHTFNRTIQDTLLGVETAYFNCISAQAGVDAALANIADARKALETAQARNTAGIGTALDVLQAQAAVDQSLYNQAVARGQLLTANGALALAVGLPADAPINPANPIAELPSSLATNDVRRTIDDAIAQRPDIAALRSDLAAKRAAIQVAHAESWPNLNLTGNINRDYTRTFSGTAQFGSHDWSYGAGLNVQWNVFDGWQTESQIRTAEEQAKSAEAVLEQAELGASADVWTRYQNYETALQKYAYSLSYLKSATAARDLASEAYAAGLKTVLDLLTADSQLATARSQQVTSRQEVFAALANLIYSTGRLTADAPELTGRAARPAKTAN